MFLLAASNLPFILKAATNTKEANKNIFLLYCPLVATTRNFFPWLAKKEKEKERVLPRKIPGARLQNTEMKLKLKLVVATE